MTPILEMIGRLGKDATIKENSNGKKFVSFSIAYDKYNSKTKESTTSWINVIWYNEKTPLLKHLKKGIQVFVRGSFDIKPGNEADSAPYSLFLYPNEVEPLTFQKEETAEQ